MGNGNFKAKYVGWRPSFTVGKTYEIKNNELIDDDGDDRGGNFVFIYPQEWEVIKESQTIIIYRKDREVIANLKEGNKVVKTAKARCCPADTFDFEVGAKLAVSRLLGITVDGNGVEKVVESASAIRIVKQDKYEVGDKVKIRSDLVGDTKYDGLTFNPDMMKYAGVIDSISSIRHDGKYYLSDSSKPGWIYNEAMFEGKVVEGAQPVVPLFDWSAFKAGKFAVHCDTEEKAREFLKECDAHGIKWCGGNKPSEWNGWKRCFSNEILFFHNRDELTYSVIPDLHRNDAIIDYTSSKPAVKEVKRHAEAGEWIKVVNAFHLSRHRENPEYSNGDVMLVNHVDGYDVYIENTAEYLQPSEYVVLEGYIPEKKQTVNEVERPAKVGEWIKIVKPWSVDKKYYSVGEICEVKQASDGGVYASTSGTHPCNIGENTSYLYHEEYVVLENYQPEEAPVDSKPEEPKPFVKAKVGDKIKIVGDIGGHGPAINIGDIQTVADVRSDNVGTDIGNVFYDRHQEYIIIEEASTIKSQPIEIGDTVKVINKDTTCNYYDEFIKTNAKGFLPKFQKGYLPANGNVGIVVGQGKHDFGGNYFVVLSEGKAFCIAERGVEKAR